MYIIPGKKSASWQLVAVVLGLKTMPRGKNDAKWPKTTQSVKTRRKIAKTNPKSKEKFA